jgi:hypothetical protein
MHVYKLINVYGDGNLVHEYYPDFRPSPFKNGTVQVKEELTDDQVRNALSFKADTSAKAVVTVPTKPVEAQSVTREYTPENITSLKPNEVFVFGSNTEGKHGAGAAKTAVDKFGAKYGQAEGLQGQSYGIITKDLAKGKRSILRSQLTDSFVKLYKFATEHPELKFYVTKLGTDLAGYTIDEIQNNLIAAKLGINIPDNIIFPKEFEFRKELGENDITSQIENETGLNTKDFKC